jgi:hypothetical protein
MGALQTGADFLLIRLRVVGTIESNSNAGGSGEVRVVTLALGIKDGRGVWSWLASRCRN